MSCNFEKCLQEGLEKKYSNRWWFSTAVDAEVDQQAPLDKHLFKIILQLSNMMARRLLFLVMLLVMLKAFISPTNPSKRNSGKHASGEPLLNRNVKLQNVAILHLASIKTHQVHHDSSMLYKPILPKQYPSFTPY